MKKRIVIIFLNIIIFVVGICVALVIFGPFAVWSKKPSSSLNLWIVDKTVPNSDYREHLGLMWVLNSKKIVLESDKEPLELDEDYYGFFPISLDEYDIKNLPSENENVDLIYLADTYGVYEDDYLKDNVQGTQSDLIYGGLVDEELASINLNLGNGNTIISEFNTASAPTNRNNRDQLGDIFKVEWMGWNGRHFQDLSEGVEVPVWAIESYENSTGQEWDFFGEGIILVSDFDEIIVLQSKTDFGKDYIQLIYEDEYVDEYGVYKEVPYDYWFEFTGVYPSAEIIANFEMDLTEKGKAKLSSLGLPTTFPAIIKTNNTQYNSYYFAGDFADGDIAYKWWKYSEFPAFKKWLPMNEKGDNGQFFWRCYVPMMSKIIDDIGEQKLLKNQTEIVDKNIKYNFKTDDDDFQILIDGEWEDFFSKGVNIGSSTPGKWFTEFSNDEGMYLDWFEQIAEMNANNIRIYTLLSPQFYDAFVYYNEQHPDAPLWLYQEIWPEENPEDHDYLKKEYNDTYFDEIENVVDAMHGKANIPYRKGRAYGIYTSDVSPYIAGYLVGRELEPEEVISTNERNEGYNYKGEYLSATYNASPTEAWLAQSCDYVLEYESSKYYWQHPVGIVSWPTLDSTEHDSEWNEFGDKDKEYNDKVSVDINNILIAAENKTGFFGAYHIYPNYPDFMNNESHYADYTDEQGSFRYGGYLQEFKRNHKKYPALVAEFGIATGMGNAHTNPDGYNHGGLTEKQQGEGIVRMMKAMENEGYAGGIIFEWSDEWAKKTWTTEPYIIPYDRNALWHNAIDPEQNYGILAMEACEDKSDEYLISGEDKVESVELSANETYLTIEINLNDEIDFNNEDIYIGIDTFERSKGEYIYAIDDMIEIAPFGLEFMVSLKNKYNAELLVQPEYNIYKGNYAQKQSYAGVFEGMTNLINKERTTKAGEHIEPQYFDHSKLRYGSLDQNSYYQWYVDENVVKIRLPWTKINISDPSGMRVLYDDGDVIAPIRDDIETVITEGVMISGLIMEQKTNTVTGCFGESKQEPFVWTGWDVPKYQERLKESYYIIQDYFGQ